MVWFFHQLKTMKKALKFKSTATAVTAVSTLTNAVKEKKRFLTACKKSRGSLTNLLEDCVDHIHSMPPHHFAASGELEALQDTVKMFGLTFSETDINKCTLLHHAARNNQVAVMRYLIENGICIDAANEDGDTALHLALREKQIEAVHVLMDFGASTGLTNNMKDPPLHTAAREKSGESLRAFLSHNVDYRVRGRRKRTVLHTIAEEDNVECLTALHQSSVCNNSCHLCLCTKDEDGLTAVHLAAKKNSSRVLEFFILSKKHTPESIVAFIDEENSTPLHSAVDAGNLEVACVLLKHGACPLVKKDNIPPPLHLACSQGRLEMVRAMVQSTGKEILEHLDQNSRSPLHYSAFSIHSTSIMSYIAEEVGQGIAINQQDSKGRTPLHMSISSGNLTGLKELIAWGADPFVKDNDENNALHFAVLHNRKAIIEALLELPNSDELANEINKKGYSPIHIGLKLGLRDIVSLLISSIQLQAKNVKDSQGNNYIHLAASSGDLNALFSFLDLANAHKLLNETNNHGHTPLHSAAKKGHTQCIERLLHSGAMAHKCHRGTSPLMLACREAHIECAKLLYKAYRFQIDWQDEAGDTALHYAAQSRNPSMVQQILDFGAEIVINDSGKSFLDEIIVSRDENCGLAVVNHRRWQECLDVVSPVLESPMLSLVKHMPSIAKAVLDRCHTREHHSAKTSDPSHYDTETFNFKYLLSTHEDEYEQNILESHMSRKVPGEKKIHAALTRAKSRRRINTEVAGADLDFVDTDLKTMTMQRKRSSIWKSVNMDSTNVSQTMEVLKRMIQYKRTDLLVHPVVSAYLKRKWNTYGLWFYSLHFIVLVPLVISLTMFVLLKPKSPLSHIANVTSLEDSAEIFGNFGNHSSVADFPDLTTAQAVFKWLTVLTNSIFAADSLVALIAQGWKSINFVDRVQMWNSGLAIMLTYLFILHPYPFIPSVLPFGAAACFFVWLTLFGSLEFFNTLGIYVSMFFKILRTVFHVLFACSFVLMAFAVSLFVIASEVPEFANVGYSLFTVFGYMLGEIQYSLFISKANAVKGSEEDFSMSVVAIIIIIVLAIMLSIVLANLLIGLAVGDIEQVKLNALYHRRALEVGYFTHVDDLGLKYFQRLTAPRSHVIRVHSDAKKSKLRRFMSCFVRRVKNNVLEASEVAGDAEIQGSASNSPADIAAEMAQMKRKLQEITDLLRVEYEGRKRQQCLRWQKPQSSFSLGSSNSDFSISGSDLLPEDFA